MPHQVLIPKHIFLCLTASSMASIKNMFMTQSTCQYRVKYDANEVQLSVVILSGQSRLVYMEE